MTGPNPHRRRSMVPSAMRILLVDDEDLSRRALRVTIERELPEFEIVGEACDGEEALELVRSLEPDLTIMDIKMPELDGIGAARSLRDEGSLSRLVFLTAYDEFDYARSAVDLQADAYLLKPVGKQELVQVIRRCAEAIRTEEARARTMLSAGERDRLRDWAYRQAVLAVINGDAERFAPLAEGAGIAFRSAVLAVVRLPESCAGSIETIERALRIDGTVARLDLAEGTSALLVVEGVPETVADRIEKRCRQTTGGGWIARVAAIGEVGPASQSAFQALMATLEDDDAIRIVRPMSDTAAAGGLNADTLDGSFSALAEPTRSLVKRLLGERSEPTRRRLLEEIFDRLDSSTRISPEAARLFVIELQTMVRLQLIAIATGQDEVPTAGLASIFAAHSVDEIRAAGMRAVGDLVSRLFTHAHPELSWRLSRALDYIVSHLAEDLYIDEVSDAVGIGPQHLSRLFKDEMDSSFTRYLNERRIEHARFLLHTSALNVAEVADRVGFRDANYFGKVFRRLTGVTPTQYRNHLREDEP